MVQKEKLYDAFGELIYAVAQADGLVQDEEINALKKILRGHPWAKEIQWSFDYEHRKQSTVENAYQKALETCRQNGPDAEYVYLIEVLEEVAQASDGIDADEKAVIDNFQTDLKERFIKDLEEGNLILK